MIMQITTELISGLYGPVWKYEWEDDLGVHQYYAECEPNLSPGPQTGFQIFYHQNNCGHITSREYRWTDSIGYHNYCVNL